MMSKARNYEFRSISSVPYVETNRDGDLRFKKGKEQYRNGKLRRPEEFIKNSKGEPMPVQWLIFKAFPDIPLRSVQKAWLNND
jgi:hypothetical protein